MRHIKNKRVTEPKLVDITCDICGKSCRDSADMNYECVSFAGSWGYMSHKDTENWSCDICEPCADKTKAFIESIGGKVEVTYYM